MGCLEHLEWDVLCDAVATRLASPAARDGGRDTLPRSDDAAVVSRWLEDLDGLEALDGAGAGWASSLAEAHDIAALIERATKDSVLTTAELARVAGTVAAAGGASARVAKGLGSEDQEVAIASVRERLSGLEPPPSLARRLDASIEREAEPRLRDTASRALGGLRRRARDARRSVITAAERILRRSSTQSALADTYWTEREGRIVVPVRSDGFSRAGAPGTVAGIIHGASSSGQTLFVEPHELVDLSNAHREAVMAQAAEERRILAELSAAVGGCAEALLASLEALIDLDLLRARLLLCRDLDAIRPRVVPPDEGARLELPAARHPLMILAGTDVVPNDLGCRVGAALILSGPNAGGKTVALKTIGILALMAQAGLRLPTGAPATAVAYPALVTDVGDDQSISANLSTFSAHVGHVLEALDAAAGGPTLALLDEVAVGTDPNQGAALAEAILVELVERGATVVATTHYERLKLLASRFPERFDNGAVGFDFEALRPTFRVSLGAPGSSSALVVARRLGLPQRLLDRAEHLLQDESLRVDALLLEMDAQRERLHRLEQAAAEERAGLERERARVAARDEDAERSAAQRLAKAHTRATAQLRALEDEIKARRKALRDAPLEGGADARGFTRDARTQLQGARAPRRATPGDPVAAVAVGDRVRVASLDAEGEVVAVKGERVTVQLGPARTTVARDDLRTGEARAKEPPRSPPQPRASSAGRYFGVQSQPVPMRVDNVVDVRGARADEVVPLVEVFLARALGEDLDIVVIRHGHGAEVLKKVIREHLPRLGHVADHRPGLPAEGGDAVTVVRIE